MILQRPVSWNVGSRTRIPGSRGHRLRWTGGYDVVPPAVLSRDEAGNTFVPATRITEPLRIDGKLDEPVYSEVQFPVRRIDLENRGFVVKVNRMLRF